MSKPVVKVNKNTNILSLFFLVDPHVPNEDKDEITDMLFDNKIPFSYKLITLKNYVKIEVDFA